MMNPEEMTILTVDDTPANIRLLTHYLEKQGYRVITAEDGFEGFKAAIQYRPDLILLDVMMPGTDGYEVCELLKAEEGTKDIPVMFLTAKTGVEDKIRGFELGAVDYIAKPFNLAEIATRVENQLTLKHFRNQSRKYLDLLGTLRTGANLGKSGECLIETLVEGLNLLRKNLDEAIQSLSKNPGVQRFLKETAGVAKDLISQCEQFQESVDDERALRKAVKMKDLVKSASEAVSESHDGAVQFDLKVPDDTLSIVGDLGDLFQAMANLLDEAYAASPGGVTLPVALYSCEPTSELKSALGDNVVDKYVCIEVEDQGEMPGDFTIGASVFNDASTSLRLKAAQAIAESHEGTVEIRAGEKGRLLRLYLPG